MAINSIQGYLDFLASPWGKMQFRLTWEQLDFAEKLRVLDFGSGMGKTADYLAGKNDVTAVEPSAEMLAHRFCGNAYRQIQGGIDDLPEGDFDLVVCHNVLEFVDDREIYLTSLAEKVAPGGRMSIVKHNHAGRVMRQAAGYNDPQCALAMMQGESPSNHFGTVRLYDTDALIAWAEGHGFVLEKHCGIRAFYGMRKDNDGWDDPAWGEAAHDLERYAEQREPYRSVAFFHHVILRKL